MEAYIRYLKDNNINSWANATLTAEELIQFQSAATANNNLWKSYQARGLYTTRDIYETVHSTILDSDIEVLVGQEIVMAAGVAFDSLTLDVTFKSWLDRYDVETGGDILVPLVQ